MLLVNSVASFSSQHMLQVMTGVFLFVSYLFLRQHDITVVFNLLCRESSATAVAGCQ